MDNFTRKMTLMLLAGYAFSVLFLFSLSFFSFPLRDVDIMYFTQWVSARAGVLFLDHFLVVNTTVLLLAHSLLLTPSDLKAGQMSAGRSFHTLLRRTLIILMVILFGYLVAEEAGRPLLHDRLLNLTYRTGQARALLAKAAGAEKQREYATARGLLEDYLLLRPTDQTVRERYESLSDRPEDRDSGTDRDVADRRSAHEVTDMNLMKLLTEARSFFDREEYFSAHYYASLAAGLDPARREPRELMDRAWTRISSPAVGHEEESGYRLYELKREGYAALTAGDYLRAYYIFAPLLDSHPADADVATYFSRSMDELAGRSFFLDEVEGSTRLHGLSDTFFLNSRDGDVREFVYMKRLFEYRGVWYAEDIEALAFRTDGTLLYHLESRYGKIVADRLLLHAVDRKDSSRRFPPRYHRGGRDPGLTDVIVLSPRVEHLKGLSAEGEVMRSLRSSEIWSLTQLYPLFGYRKELAELELIRRAARMFGFIILSLFAIGVGWKYRSRYLPRPPLLLSAMVPLLPFAVAPVVEIYLYCLQVLAGLLLTAGGLLPTVVVFVVLQGVLLFLSLLYLSAQVMAES